MPMKILPSITKTLLNMSYSLVFLGLGYFMLRGGGNVGYIFISIFVISIMFLLPHAFSSLHYIEISPNGLEIRMPFKRRYYEWSQIYGALLLGKGVGVRLNIEQKYQTKFSQLTENLFGYHIQLIDWYELAPSELFKAIDDQHGKSIVS